MLLNVFIVITVLRLVYWVYYFRKVKTNNIDTSPSDEVVSIVVCVKNNKEGILDLLPQLLNQTHQFSEIIIVDDYSSDGLEEIKSSFPKVKWLTPSEDRLGKKAALSFGIRKATSKWILLTDSDCIVGPRWVEKMVASADGYQMVLGVSPMTEAKHLINDFARYESVVTALQYIGYAAQGNSYMGVGRNLLFSKELFNEVGGFEGHKDIISGDDDLFVQDVMKIASIGYCTDKNAIVTTPAKPTILEYFRQKRRHIATSFSYSLKHRLQLAIFAAIHIVWLMLMIMLFFRGTQLLLVLVITSGFWIIASMLHFKGFKMMKSKDLIYKFPILDTLMGVYYLLLGFFSIKDRLTNNKRWN